MIKVKRVKEDLLLTVGKGAGLGDLIKAVGGSGYNVELSIDRVYILDYNNGLVYDTGISPWMGDLQELEGTTLLSPCSGEAERRIIKDIASLKWA